MTFDGFHFICKKHKRRTYYSDVVRKWLCVDCELDEALA